MDKIWRGMHTQNSCCTTNRYRHNTITMLTNNEGASFSGNDKKQPIFGRISKKRMGVSKDPSMLFDMDGLIQPVDAWRALLALSLTQKLNRLSNVC